MPNVDFILSSSIEPTITDMENDFLDAHEEKVRLHDHRKSQKLKAYGRNNSGQKKLQHRFYGSDTNRHQGLR